MTAQQMIALCVMEIAIKKAEASPSPILVSEALAQIGRVFDRHLIPVEQWLKSRDRVLTAAATITMTKTSTGWSMIDAPNGGHPCSTAGYTV